jgi:hypothetical protein
MTWTIIAGIPLPIVGETAKAKRGYLQDSGASPFATTKVGI